MILNARRTAPKSRVRRASRSGSEPCDDEDRRGFFQKHPAAKPVVFLVAIVALLLVGWFWWESRHWEDTDDAQIDGHIYPVSARVSGQVIKVNFDDGQFVHKGDMLVIIDPTDYRSRYNAPVPTIEDSQAQAEAAGYGVPVSSVGFYQPDSFGQR